MSETQAPHETGDQPRDPRRKKILFRCWHRGMKEMDLLLGGFANAEIDKLNDAELSELEHLLTAHDQDLYAWITGRKPLPPEWDGPLYRRIIAYHETAGPAGFIK
ncbi:succinate dehydrogenase assembly factor 2 [Roseibium denhamense]|uniref:FAD assembly factor SdhE n=1 Tax=Roseibium denhamense TaxID=76305 RepID=A0ABY1NQU9_9HYPH|nr:succinate dehydrogenase assembly factor 2 [Roseibium denhamense]MTI07899.1 succinate dehydrogenase assembly factor 2 [Roseibium denhamense]SMP14810.1 antitoxin CptB [Roseibium denhamense]